MASRRELVQRFVLNSICDDLEHLDISIMPAIKRTEAGSGLTISKPEVVQGLSDLVDLGWAKAYIYRSDKQYFEEIEGMPSLEEMEEPHGDAWFGITDEGMKVQLAPWDGWPFDEDNNLRKDWTPPED